MLVVLDSLEIFILCVQKYLLMIKTLFSLESHILTHVSFISEHYEIMKYVIYEIATSWTANGDNVFGWICCCVVLVDWLQGFTSHC